MKIEKAELHAIAAIKNIKYVGEIREDSYKRAVLHTYDAAIHLYNDGYYPAANQNCHWCADMAVKLYLWKKHLVNYTDYHNLPMARILNWMPQKEKAETEEEKITAEKIKQAIVLLRELHELYEQFGDYMEMVEEYPEHLFGTAKNDLFDEKIKPKNKEINKIQQAARKAILLIDTALPVLLDFEK
ncbi:hypothetical protein HZA99_05745 [Candidatus Woesearchaeota archaeon]|nr:hypothetical protein [Candidatus Woesearchaeota archaeon]